VYDTLAAVIGAAACIFAELMQARNKRMTNPVLIIPSTF